MFFSIFRQEIIFDQTIKRIFSNICLNFITEIYYNTIIFFIIYYLSYSEGISNAPRYMYEQRGAESLFIIFFIEILEYFLFCST